MGFRGLSLQPSTAHQAAGTSQSTAQLVHGKVHEQGPPTVHPSVLLYQEMSIRFLLSQLCHLGKKKKKGLKGLYNIQAPCWRHQVLWRSTRLPRKNRWKRGRFWFNTPRGNFVMKSRAATQNKRPHDMMLIFRMSDSLALWCERCKRNKTPILLLTAQKLDRFFLNVIIFSMALARFHACISLAYMWLH